jgi:hypothetical protein
VLRVIDHARPGSFTIQLQALLFQLQYPNAVGVPVLRYNTAPGQAQSLLSFVPADYHAWPQVMLPGTGKKPTPVCVAQLVGLLQFGVIPRHPQIGQSKKWGNWGYPSAGVFATTLYHQWD